MGTRNLTAVFYKGKYRVAQYGQWDGYPSGQGFTVLDFFNRKDFNMDKFKKAVRRCKFIGDEEIQKRYKSVGADGGGWVTMDIADKFKAKWSELSRDTGAGILNIVYDKNGAELCDNIEFAQDSLFCEWAYIIDLDKNVLECYSGFNKSPVSKENRFQSVDKNEEYQPIVLLKTYSLDDLPNKKSFEKNLNKLCAGAT